MAQGRCHGNLALSRRCTVGLVDVANRHRARHRLPADLSCTRMGYPALGQTDRSAANRRAHTRRAGAGCRQAARDPHRQIPERLRL